VTGPQDTRFGPSPKSIAVPVPVEEAFRAYVELAMEWVPPAHRITTGTNSMTIEPWAGGRFYETAGDGAQAVRGTVLEWSPPTRLAMTWRVGPGWQVLADDEHACHVQVDFVAQSASTTEVRVGYTHLEHCEPSFAAQLTDALSVPGPGETLERYAQVIARHAGGPAGARQK